MVWPTIKQSENTEMFKSKLRYQAIFYTTNENRLFCKTSEMTFWWNTIVMISFYTATLITNIEMDLLFFRSGMETSVSESARMRKIFSPFWIGTTGWISYT